MIKTGVEWAEEYKKLIKIRCFDGWPDYPADFNCVPITKQEFLERVAAGTVEFLARPSVVFEGAGI